MNKHLPPWVNDTLLRPRLLALLVPLAFGLLSLLLGQDTSWDLQNYHRYNPWALLHGRWNTDLAPAGMQSYFNPLIDLPFYALTQALPPLAVGLLMGLLHGCCFIPLHAIARRLLPGHSKRLTAAGLALGGCLGLIFLSQLGTTAGDDTAALPILCALALLLRLLDVREPQTARSALGLCLLAGAVAGVGVGLKLTQAPYAAGAFLALLLGRRDKPVLALAFGIGTLAGLALTAGFWFALMTHTFGNPLFPQFNSLFKAELAAAVSVVDTKWRPQGWLEALLFPIVFTLKPQRISELPMTQLLWPLVYVLMGGWALKTLSSRWHRRGLDQGAAAGPGAERFFFLFLIFSYLAWMAVFSIGRYLVVLELLLPLSCWLLFHRLVRWPLARHLTLLAIGVSLLHAVLHLDASRRADWAPQSYAIQTPVIEQAPRATVLVLGAPLAWLLPAFPPELAFVSLASNFPESPAYERRAQQIMQTRGGPLYAIVPASQPQPAQRWSAVAQGLQDFAEARNMPYQSRRCSALAWISGLTPYRRAQEAIGTGMPLCGFVLPALAYSAELADRELAQEQAIAVSTYGIDLDVAACKRYSAAMGKQAMGYQFCPARVR